MEESDPEEERPEIAEPRWVDFNRTGQPGLSSQDHDILYLYYCIKKYPMLKLNLIYSIVKEELNYDFEYTREEILASGEHLIEKQAGVLEQYNPFEEFFETKSNKPTLSVSGSMEMTFVDNPFVDWVRDEDNDDDWDSISFHQQLEEDLALQEQRLAREREREIARRLHEERQESRVFRVFQAYHGPAIEKYRSTPEEDLENQDQDQTERFPNTVERRLRDEVTTRIRDQTYTPGQYLFPTLFETNEDPDER